MKARQMKIYDLVEIVIKDKFKKEEFSLSDIKKYMFEVRRLTINHSYLSMLLNALRQKNYIKLVRTENEDRSIFPKKYYVLNNNNKWEDVFK